MTVPNGYRPGGDADDITRPIVGQILATMADGSCSLLDLAEAAHIPARDLAATFGGQRELTVTEFFLIARRLGVRASTLIPRADLEQYVEDLPSEAQR